MIAPAPLILTPEVHADLAALRELAAACPVNIIELMEAMKDPNGRARHAAQMAAQTVEIPGPYSFYVTLSYETGQPAGGCRHMSMSIGRKERIPSPEAVWMVAELLGFVGGLEQCAVWRENLSDGRVAINLVQPIAVTPAGGPGRLDA